MNTALFHEIFHTFPQTSTDHYEGVFCRRPDPDMSLLQVLLRQQPEAREQVAVVDRLSQSSCCLLVDLGQSFFPQLDHPGGERTVYSSAEEYIDYKTSSGNYKLLTM